MLSNRIIKNTPADKVFLFCVYLFLVTFLLVVLYPLVFVVSASFSTPAAVSRGRVWLLPVQPTLMAYKAVFRYQQIKTGFSNSFIYMTLGTFFTLVFTVLAAFPLSRKEFYGRGILTFILAFTMYFSGGIVPTYLLITSLGLLDTRAVMIIPGLVNVWHIIMCRTYFQSTIPDEIYESAQIDGCSDVKYMINILVPLSKPILAVLGLYTGVGIWNSYFGAMMYLSKQYLFPLQLVLRDILVLSRIDYTQFDAEAIQAMQGLSDLMKYAVIVVSSVPVMALYPFAQKYFVKGVMIGSLKG